MAVNNHIYEVAICDDEKIYTDEIEKVLKEELGKYCEEYNIRYFNTADDYLTHLEIAGESDLLVLDVEMPGMDGIGLKDRLNDAGSICSIIFVTNHSEAMPDAFGKNVVGFIDKAVLREKLPIYLKKVMSHKRSDKKLIVDMAKGSIVKESDIVYIKADKKYTVVYCKDKEYLSNKSITEWEEELRGVVFFRCHRSYIVNFSLVKKIATDKICLYGDISVPISRKLRGETERRYSDYLIKSI